MTDCRECQYAEWDYEEYYGTTQKQWFVSGCKKDLEADEECEAFEEKQDDLWNKWLMLGIV